MEDKVIEFFRRCVYGSSYKRDKKKDIENIIMWCFNNAWRDMARTLKPKDEFEQILSGYRNKQARETEILTLKNYIKDKYFNQNIVDNLKQQRFEPIDYIKSIKADKVINQSKMEFAFGQAQKVVNMFFKYLYTFKDEQCVKLSEQDFDNCDCPIDSIILDKLYKTEKYKGTVWSKIDGGQYNEIQKDIQNIVNNSTKYKNKLDFEFDWE